MVWIPALRFAQSGMTHCRNNKGTPSEPCGFASRYAEKTRCDSDVHIACNSLVSVVIKKIINDSGSVDLSKLFQSG